MYATKRRQRNFKRVREQSAGGCKAGGSSTSAAGGETSGVQQQQQQQQQQSTNPSKRHRERLNGELEVVASLLPYDQNVISRLDKLSVLRLAVSYLEVKAHVQVSLQRHFMQNPYCYGYPSPFGLSLPGSFLAFDRLHANENAVFKAVGGFVLILNDNGEIYYASDNIETYLGFHQSDILHQPVYDMVHSEDREEIRQQLSWTYGLAQPQAVSFHELLSPGGTALLERNCSARFRCLLDNTCGFLRIDIRGRLAPLYGLPHNYIVARSDPSLPVLGLVAVCSPFVPPPSLDGVDTEPFLKTKHSLDFALVSADAKAKQLLEIGEEKTLPTPFYGLLHSEDALCLAEAHKEVLKSGASGLLVYRLISSKSQRTYWVQSSCRLFYKNGKPDTIGCTHRLLTEVEGTVLLEKRASLSAKMLSFDDSLLQSPKLLQSTAALTVANAGADVPSCSSIVQPAAATNNSRKSATSTTLKMTSSRRASATASSSTMDQRHHQQQQEQQQLLQHQLLEQEQQQQQQQYQHELLTSCMPQVGAPKSYGCGSDDLVDQQQQLQHQHQQQQQQACHYGEWNCTMLDPAAYYAYSSTAGAGGRLSTTQPTTAAAFYGDGWYAYQQALQSTAEPAAGAILVDAAVLHQQQQQEAIHLQYHQQQQGSVPAYTAQAMMQPTQTTGVRHAALVQAAGLEKSVGSAVIFEPNGASFNFPINEVTNAILGQ